ncbi:hypothetical protein BZA05DRAFT_407019 [Tricharina praecox]|uniref:uncharacterized protein n=1 Tax=Tricharina praecox TaxID=43433 RepID=UPI00221EF5C1|nr:uncharacterized protein BZA05DRAFT_407019 [Tricharina praecox]KAI5846126.1 hypothetical protein BZA05DRAFT_407019 [Tricharina praecox]
MGSSTSKPSGEPIVIHGQTPIRFSNSLVTTLTQSSETDSTREKQLELHIQARVAEELARLEAREGQVLAGIDERLQQAEVKEGEGDRVKVQHDIEALRERLDRIPKLMELEEGVELARQSVLGCLRNNNTRPLDCWKEVADFKEHTRRMEKAFVVRTVGRGY